jgi:serine/threonine protein kinase/KaiC/GvpD/RAD55 family RecA-like ATPase
MPEPKNANGAPISEEAWEQASRLYHRLKRLSSSEQAERLAVMRASGEANSVVLLLLASHLEQRPEPDQLLTGERIGDFMLKERIGVGGMGEVYVAEQMIGLKARDVAVKILRPTFEHGEEPQERINRMLGEIGTLEELRTVAKLRANIVAVHAAGLYPDPRTQQQLVYIAMELVREGQPITMYANKYDLRDDERIGLFEKVCTTVGEINKRGILHLDLKPPNILVDYEGEPFVIDFGIARIYDELQPGGYQPLLGTLAYMSPEQLVDVGPISSASDVYALGVILYELLARQHPYGRSLTLSYDDLRAIVLEATPRLLGQTRQELSGTDLEHIVSRALAPKPDERIHTALELADRLAAYRQTHRDRTLIEREYAASRPWLDLRGSSPYVETDEVMEPNSKMPEKDEATCPYRGLEAFQAEHARFFFGREELTKELLERLSPLPGSVEAKRFLAVIGPSGYGKSSLVQAGLVAQLQQGHLEDSAEWSVLTCKPGESPLESLALALVAAPELQRGLAAVIQSTGATVDQVITALRTEIRTLHRLTQVTLQNAPATRRIVVVVDQFEEIFTLCTKEEERTAFIRNLLQAAITMGGRTIIVLTMRDDFYGTCARYPDLAAALSNGQEVLVRRMTRAELHRAIEEPARQKHCTFDRGLVEELVDEVIEEPGSLPALQDVLRALWERHDPHKRVLTRTAYQEIGGVKGALQQRAETVYKQFAEQEQADCKRIFRRLV